jgi:peptidoglycan lytic transglycosylase G
MPASGKSQPASAARAMLGASEPQSPISGRSDGVAGLLAGGALNTSPVSVASLLDQKRIAPRSPRAALEPDHVPVPTHSSRPSSRPSRRTRNPLVIVGNAIFTLLVLILIGGGGAAVVGKTRFEAPGPLAEDKVVTIPPRSGMRDIADLLKKEGVIDEHRLVFMGGVIALKAKSDLKAGEYVFPKRASVRDVVEILVEGKVVQHQITIPEGLTSEQIVTRLLENEMLSGNIKDVPREGSLLPDGYHINRGFTREQMLQRMRQAQDRLVREIWERRNPDLPLRTPEQLVILASIIEKETGKPEERTRVAAVFANRLKQKMKLQSDPTIVYGLVFGKGSLGRPLSKADIAQPTPYNTYVIDGLPPGPIANPGRASIEAAANPARTKELFFVADGTGGHAFADTYDQHLKNVARLRAIEQGGDPGPAPGASDAQSPGRGGPAAAPGRGKRSANGTSKSAGAAQ